MAEIKPVTSHTSPPAFEQRIPAVKARQGVISGRVSLVLAVSLALVIVAFAVIYTFHV
jgi:hypothetical protein